MANQIRLLLTQKCNARCSYCHNEGQESGLQQLSLEAIAALIARFAEQGCVIDEFVLSGGEPTLHPQLVEIATLCKSTGARVSINTHGGMPQKLAAVMPWIDEVKLHLDSFDAARQQQAMGIRLDRVEQSLALLAANPQVQVLLNHPVSDVAHTRDFIDEACRRGLDCKLLHVFGEAQDSSAEQLQLAQKGYVGAGIDWRHPQHRLVLRECTDRPEDERALFIGADGVRHALDGQHLGFIEAVVPSWLTAGARWIHRQAM